MAGFALIAAVMMALMSLFYLKQIPGKPEMDRLEAEMRQQHGSLLASAEPIAMEIARPKQKGQKLGLKVTCVARPDLRARGERTVQSLLERLGRTALEHNDWKGRIGFVTLVHPEDPVIEITVRFAPLEPVGVPTKIVVPAGMARGGVPAQAKTPAKRAPKTGSKPDAKAAAAPAK